MEILLEELYKLDLHIDKYHDRKLFLDDKYNYQIVGITQSGKTKLIKNYLLEHKKSSYIFIDCNDTRIKSEEINKILEEFCIANSIEIVAFDNYKQEFNIPNVKQVILSSELAFELKNFKTLQLNLLDYEEFLAYEHRYDSSAVTHFFHLGGFAHMHKLSSDVRALYIQKILQTSLTPIEFAIVELVAKMNAQKLSAYAIYERLKGVQKISKDKLYKSFEGLLTKGYIHQLSKLNHPKAVKKLYLCDIALKNALSIDKHFGRLFENMIFLELFKSNVEVFYEEGVEFYLPHNNSIVLCMPFSDERTLFKKLEQLEAFIFSYQITTITAVTMSKEATISHPLSKVTMVPFDIWALGD